MFKKMTGLLSLTFLMAALLGCSSTPAETTQKEETPPMEATNTDTLFQVSTLKALMDGVYDGAITVAELTENGDLGIGTFEGLDGEMLVLDGVVYQVKADGKAVTPDSSILTPFAAVTDFEGDLSGSLQATTTYDELKAELDPLLPSNNVFYAFRIDGEFSYVKTRSVPKQSEPYPVLSEVTKNQPTFEFQNVKGTIIGFWCPDYAEGVNLPGYHLHFINEDHTAGGHLLECAITKGSYQIDTTTEFQLVLPDNEHFLKAGFDDVTEAEVQGVEK